MKRYFIAVLLLMFSLSLLANTTYSIPTTVVTADRISISNDKTSYRVQIITKSDIKKLHLSNLSEILNYSSSIISMDNGYDGSVSRISIRGGFSSHVLFMIDGIPMNSSFNGSPSISSLPVEYISRIEIIEGSASSIYGTGSVSGIVNIITDKSRHNEFSISLKDRNSYNASASLYSPLGKLSFNSLNNRGWRSNTDYIKNNILWNKRIVLSKFNLNLQFMYNYSSIGVPGPLPDISFLPEFGDSTATCLFDNQKDRNYLGKISFAYSINRNNALNLQFASKFDSLQYYSQYRSYFDSSLQYSYYKYLTISNIPEFFYTFYNKYISSSIGFYGNLQNNYSRTDIYGDTSILVDSSSWKVKYNTYAIFHECKIDLFSRIILEEKLRYDIINVIGDTVNRNFKDFSYFAGMVFKFEPIMLKINYGTAFKNPGLNDLFFPYMGNPNLKPENSREFSALAGLDLGKYNIDISYFYKNIYNLIYWSGMVPDNINKVKAQGIEFNCNFKISILSSHINGIYMNSKSFDIIDTTNIPVERKTPYSPDFKVSYGLQFNLPFSMSLNGSGVYTSSYLNYFANYSSGGYDTLQIDNTFLLNASLSKKIAGTNLTISVNNIADIRSAKSFGYSIYDRGYPYDGRRISFIVSSSF